MNSAGNSGHSSWFGAAADADGDNLLEFAADQERLDLNINESTIVQLRWDGDWGAEATDLDLHLFDATGNPLAQSLNPQEGRAGNRPYEIAFPATSGQRIHRDNQPDRRPAPLDTDRAVERLNRRLHRAAASPIRQRAPTPAC